MWIVLIVLVLLIFALASPLRRFILILALGVPSMLIGYLWGFVQSGLITGYNLYSREAAPKVEGP